MVASIANETGIYLVFKNDLILAQMPNLRLKDSKLHKPLQYNWYYTSDIYYCLRNEIDEIREYRVVVLSTVIKSVAVISILFQNGIEIGLTGSFKRTDDKEERGTICFSPIVSQAKLNVTKHKLTGFQASDVSIVSVYDDHYCVDVGVRLQCGDRYLLVACANMPGDVTGKSNFIPFFDFDSEYPETDFTFRPFEQ
jgi:hypothetical protein